MLEGQIRPSDPNHEMRSAARRVRDVFAFPVAPVGDHDFTCSERESLQRFAAVTIRNLDRRGPVRPQVHAQMDAAFRIVAPVTTD